FSSLCSTCAQCACACLAIASARRICSSAASVCAIASRCVACTRAISASSCSFNDVARPRSSLTLRTCLSRSAVSAASALPCSVSSANCARCCCTCDSSIFSDCTSTCDFSSVCVSAPTCDTIGSTRPCSAATPSSFCCTSTTCVSKVSHRLFTPSTSARRVN